jgi:ribulose-5-phosphate 4-epimerase/fuculose-1-phosphate aldolase
MLASHGPVVAGLELEAAVYAIEELEETAKLCLLLRGMSPAMLSDAQIRDLATHYKIEWD